ncbi:MAG: hypothetical protein AAGL17_21795, partial [Cyanobacteria bacterium J06576_12]
FILSYCVGKGVTPERESITASFIAELVCLQPRVGMMIEGKLDFLKEILNIRLTNLSDNKFLC